jgi:chromosome segregation ATPase
VDGHNLQGHRDEAAQLRNSLKRSGAMNELEQNTARNELVQLDPEIDRLVRERKTLEVNVKTKRTALQVAKKIISLLEQKRRRSTFQYFPMLKTY